MHNSSYIDSKIGNKGNIAYSDTSPDSVAIAVLPTKEHILAYIFAHYDTIDEVSYMLDRINEIPMIDLGREMARLEGYPIIYPNNKSFESGRAAYMQYTTLMDEISNHHKQVFYQLNGVRNEL